MTSLTLYVLVVNKIKNSLNRLVIDSAEMREFPPCCGPKATTNLFHCRFSTCNQPFALLMHSEALPLLSYAYHEPA